MDNETISRLSPRRRFLAYSLAAVIAVSLTVGLAELITRIVFASQVGPRVMFYGTPWERQQHASPTEDEISAQVHHNYIGDYQPYGVADTGYAKYFPYEKRFTKGMDDGEKYPIQINNHGFRGPDYEIAKAPGTLRVLTLGASSTFGYHDRDRETYPHYLQERLAQAAKPGQRFEVINLGIPHATSFNIVSILRREGLPLEPDFVTLYAGVNDAAIMEHLGDTHRLWRRLRKRMLLAEFFNFLAAPRTAMNPKLWEESYAQRRAEIFIDNVARLRQLAAENDFELIIVTQQARSLLVLRNEVRGVTYQQEQAIVRQALPEKRTKAAQRGASTATFASRQKRSGDRILANWDNARIFWIHGYLMHELRKWMAANDVAMIDGVELLDDRRDLVVSWVHLAAEANRMLAKALAETILERSADPASR